MATQENTLSRLISRQVAKPDTLLFKIHGKPSVPVLSVADAAAKWEKYRMAEMETGGGGCSQIGNGGTVYGTKNGRGCHVVARISYNGRIWS